MNPELIFKKLTTRSLLAFYVTSIFAYVVYVVTTQNLQDNPALNQVVGALIVILTMVFTFYFRKAQSKESENSIPKPTSTQTSS